MVCAPDAAGATLLLASLLSSWTELVDDMEDMLDDLLEEMEDDEQIPYISGSGEGSSMKVQLRMQARAATRISRSI